MTTAAGVEPMSTETTAGTVPATALARRLSLPALTPLEWAGLLLPMVALAILGLRDIGGPSLWRDEVSSVLFARGSLGELLTIVGRDREAVGLANMATYYLILHFWLIVGETEARVRLLSLIIGVLSVVPVYVVARRLGGWMAGALAASVFILIPYVIAYSQEARGYSLAMLMAGTMTWLLLVGVERRDRAWPWLAYGVIGALGLYVHFFMALVVAAHGLWVLATWQLPTLRAAAAAVVPLALAAAPIPFIIAEFGSEHGWIPALTDRRAYLALEKLLGGLWPLVGFSILLLVGVAVRLRDARYWLLVASAVLPIAGAIAISLVKPMFIPRYLIMVLPPLAMAVGVAVMSLRPPLVRPVLAVALVGVLAAGLPAAYGGGQDTNWRAAGRWMAEEIRPGDRIVMMSWHGSPLEYYLLRFEPPAEPARMREDEALLEAVDGRVWVSFTGVRRREVDEKLRQYGALYRIEASRTFGRRARIVLLVPWDEGFASGPAASLLRSDGSHHGQEGR